MFCVILKTPCMKCIVYVLNRQFHMSSSLSAKRRFIPKVHSNPGLRNLEKVHQDDPDALKALEDEYDESLEVMNFMRLDNAYEDHFREKQWNKTRVERIITSKQFFKPKKNPCMLTCSEKEHMRFLHKSDPIHWDIKTLSENFPATTNVVKKILKAKWKLTPEKQKKIDETVERNWQLLAEGKLDADLDVIEHCKKFVNNRQIILDHIKAAEFHLPEVNTEKTYNNNDMSKIICYYERCIKDLEKDFENKQISDQNLPVNKKSSLEVIYENIKNEQSNNLENKESFLLGKMVKLYQKNITLEELEKNILTKAAKNKSLNLHEKAILERKLNDINQNDNNNYDFSEFKDVETIKIQSEEISLCNQSQMSLHVEEEENENYDNFLLNKKKDNMFHNQSFSIDQKQSDIKKVPFVDTMPEKEINNEKMSNLTKENESSLMNEVKITGEGIKEEKYNFENIIPKKDSFGVTSCIKENAYVKMDFKTNNNDAKDSLTNYSNKMKTYVSKNLSELSSENKLTNFQSASENLSKNLSDEIDDDDDDDIETTGFWNSNYDKAAAEAQKASLGPKKISKNLNTDNLAKDEPYPLKIIIPKEKRYPGLTYKLRDCYYDDDGSFLYRVPGMTK